MKEECKVYIKGVQGRGDEVIKTLTDLGAKNYVEFDGENTHAVYFITHDGNVGMTPCGNEIEEMLMEYCHEVKLPEKEWKDGDILVDDDNPNRFIVKSNAWSGGWKNNFKAYLFVNPKSIQESPIAIFCGAEYHKADLKEIRRFHKFLHMHGKDWDAEKKQLVDWRWKPKKEEDYWAVILDPTIIMLVFTWIGSVTDEIRYKLIKSEGKRSESVWYMFLNS